MGAKKSHHIQPCRHLSHFTHINALYISELSELLTIKSTKL